MITIVYKIPVKGKGIKETGCSWCWPKYCIYGHELLSFMMGGFQ